MMSVKPCWMKSLFTFVVSLSLTSLATAQIVINEIVEDEQDFETGGVDPDTREFVELYNAGSTAVDLSNWQLNVVELSTGASFSNDTLPSGSMIAPGGYFVIGQAGVPNVNFTPVAGELWPNAATVFEIRRPAAEGGALEDAVGLETFRGSELANATQEQLDQIAAGQTVGSDPVPRGGWWGQIESNNAHPSDPNFPNLPLSLGRYLDGRDNNLSGRDFGVIPATPGASNNLAQAAAHVVPDVDAAAVGSVLRDDYYASFKLPRVIAPGTVSSINPNVIPESPQGGNAIIAWDETGGGNAIYSDNYVNKFDLYAFIDPRPFNNASADTTQSEVSIYGIGTTDPLFATSDSAGLLSFGSSANGSTGLGWVIQRATVNLAGTQTSNAVLQLVDFNDGGDSVPADDDWQVITTIDLTGASADWHRLGVEYDPVTGEATGTYDDQTFDFTTATDLVGNFYAGYRESLPGTGSPIARPPTFDLFVSSGGGVVGDYDGSGTVDAGDYAMWKSTFGDTVADGTGADGNSDGIVDAADYTIWRDNLGATQNGSLQASNVPEPAAIVLLAGLAGAAFVVRRSARHC